MRGVLAMAALLALGMAMGWMLGGPDAAVRRTFALTTSLRNLGVSLVIASSALPRSPAVTAVVGYGLFGIAGSLLLAAWWHRQPATGPTLEANANPGRETVLQTEFPP